MSNIEHDNSYVLANGPSAVPPVLQFDPANYAAEVDAFDLTETQKQELLSTLWSIMRNFVELGFTVDLCTALSTDLTPIPDHEELR